ncbi:MAG: hypothetical protein VR65_24895 [Desulfobulbaceae bacterium BRH_c16a]|nr:MAG: hypothetical protein VR65_24895 [Desulfobulbaceae bacterium BRH_c16a]
MSKKSFKKLAKRTLNLLQLSQEVRAVNVNDSPASAGESLVRLEPSNRLRSLSFAILTRNFNLLAIEHDALLALRAGKKIPRLLQVDESRLQVKLVALQILAGVGGFVNFFITKP